VRSEADKNPSAMGVLLAVIGVAVATARELRRTDRRSRARTWGDFVITTLAWPFYLPTILVPGERPTNSGPRGPRPEDRRLDRAERALDSTLEALDGVALDALRSELPRLRGLAGGLRPWVARLAELEAELARPESDLSRVEANIAELAARGVDDDDPRMASVRARAHSLRHLAALRTRSADELERALLELEELITQLRVLRFAGPRPKDVSIERLRQLATSVTAVRDALLAAE
jgi:hypothetical protein